MARLKLKSHRGAAKRFKITGTGKLMRRSAGKSHLLTKKARGRKRILKGLVSVFKGDEAAMRRLIPYGGR